MMKIMILGAGDQAKVTFYVLKESKIEVSGFVDIFDNPAYWGNIFEHVKVLGGTDYLEQLIKCTNSKIQSIVAFGDNQKRKEVYLKYSNDIQLINVIHPITVINETVTLGNGIFIGPNVVINHHVKIKNNCIINTGAIIEHDCVIGAHSHVAPGSRIAGNVKIGEGTYIGIGATIIDDVTIGNNVIVGAGATVINNIPDNVVVVGTPAKIIKHNKI